MSKRIFLTGIIGGLFLGAASPGALAGQNMDADVTLQVAEPDGAPVDGAAARVTFRYWRENPFGRAQQTMEGVTDEQGTVKLSATTSGSLSYEVEKAGYYGSARSFSFNSASITIPVPLRPRRTPAAMSALQGVRLPFPDSKRVWGLDLMKMDWMPPYGEGEREDVRVQLVKRTYKEDAYRASIRVSFVDKGNGMQPVSLDETMTISEFKVDYDAPADGYQGTNVFETVMNMVPDPDAETAYAFYFRIRSESKDGANGLYGRLHGNVLSYEGAELQLDLEQVYLNPVPANRCVEFDPDRNKAKEHVAGRWQDASYLDVRIP